MSLLASNWTYSDRAPCANCITFAAAVVALSPIVSLTLCIMYCCTCGSFKALLAVTLPASPLAYPAACAASLILHPVATSVSTSAVCLSVSLRVSMSVSASAPLDPPTFTYAKTTCQRTLPYGGARRAGVPSAQDKLPQLDPQSYRRLITLNYKAISFTCFALRRAKRPLRHCVFQQHTNSLTALLATLIFLHLLMLPEAIVYTMPDVPPRSLAPQGLCRRLNVSSLPLDYYLHSLPSQTAKSGKQLC